VRNLRLRVPGAAGEGGRGGAAAARAARGPPTPTTLPPPQVATLFARAVDWGLLLTVVPLCLAGRAAAVFPLARLVNTRRAVPLPASVTRALWAAGLRGAVAYGLALNLPNIDAESSGAGSGGGGGRGGRAPRARSTVAPPPQTACPRSRPRPWSLSSRPPCSRARRRPPCWRRWA